MNGVMSTILNKKQLGAIGENLVQTKLMQLGLNVVNANIIRPDYEAIDLICSLPGSKNAACIQVKTCRDSNFPIGMTLGKCTEDYLKEKIKGPWVFVHVSGEGVKMEFRYYILTREEMIALSSESNFWYVNRWKTTYCSKPVNLKNACGLELKWLMGEGEEDNYKHEAFINPIKVSAENRWDKIASKAQDSSWLSECPCRLPQALSPVQFHIEVNTLSTLVDAIHALTEAEEVLVGIHLHPSSTSARS